MTATLGLCLMTTWFDNANSQPGVEKPVQIVSSDARGVTLTFTLQKWTLDRIEVDRQEFVKVDFFDAGFTEKAGYPQIPYHVAVLGIPDGASIQYQIIESDYEILDDVKLLPFPRFKKVEDVVQEEFILDQEVYGRTGDYPPSLVMIGKPEYFRNQQVVRIEVFGVQYMPAKNKIKKYNRITLKIEFVGGKTTPVPPPVRRSRSEESLYRHTILNYQQAVQWRRVKSKAASLSKRASLFGTNQFYKMTIQEEGIYKIDGKFLESNGINLSEIEPSKVRLFNNGGRELPRDMNQPRPDGLLENAILVEDGGDGRFDRDDFILFYGVGVSGWDYDSQKQSYSHYINHYGFDNVYWITWEGQQDGKRMQEVASPAPTGAAVNTYQGRIFVEEEQNSPLRSGLDWFGWLFASDEFSRKKLFTFTLPNAVPDDSLLITYRFASINQGIHGFAVLLNGSFVDNVQFAGLSPELDGFVRMRAFTASVELGGGLIAGDNKLQFEYSPPFKEGQAYMDWFELLYTARLNAVDDELAFTVFPASGARSYQVGNFSDKAVQLFDVTDFSNVKQIVGTDFANGNLTFTDAQDPSLPRRYIALNSSKFRSVPNIERVETTDLRTAATGAEFVIVTHEDFLSEALRLESFRENGNPDNRLETVVVRISDIYDNFSGGLMDPVAIRDFLKYAFENWDPAPGYVLLLGDGDYDHRNIISKADKNWIPTYQTTELVELGSRTADSRYTYVAGNDAVMDMAIGRLNVQTLTDAKNAVDKIIAYETQPLRGAWRNTVTMVGDDELNQGGRPDASDARLHIPQAESIAENYLPKSFDVEKIYLSEFPKVLSASVSGVRKPAAEEALIRQINKGTLIVNYIGHGNATQWAHEIVFQKADNDRVQNQDKLVFFVAATCDWALYDNPQSQSQAEELLLTENRGAIAMLSSARLVFSGNNAFFNKQFYPRLFPAFGQSARIGDAFVSTRIRTRNTVNDEKFHIFGDPTLRLAIPRQEVVITSMQPDSIVALNTIEVEGEVRKDGQVWSSFNGKALVTTFDSRKFVKHFPEIGGPVNYFLPGNTIFRGTTSVTNGKFTAKFIVPKDISYGGKQARLSTYVWNDETDGEGYRDNILVSGTTSNLVDTRGPRIRISFESQPSFTTGDIVGENELLIVDIGDSLSGVNIAGEIGHRLTLSIDPDQETCLSELSRFLGIGSIDLTGLFQFNEGDHLRGRVEFPLNFPKEVDIGGKKVPCVAPNGEDRHTLLVKAWDNSNNSTTAAVEVAVIHDQSLVLREVLNYPNPFSRNTTFSFFSNLDAQVQIKIYTISGQLIRTLPREYLFARSGFNMIEWDGRDEDGDFPSNGIYLYKLTAKATGESGTLQKEVIGRLAIIR
ncbi:MAG: type IX secretion system sortase PorU [bacterium]